MYDRTLACDHYPMPERSGLQHLTRQTDDKGLTAVSNKPDSEKNLYVARIYLFFLMHGFSLGPNTDYRLGN